MKPDDKATVILIVVGWIALVAFLFLNLDDRGSSEGRPIECNRGAPQAGC